MKHLHDTLRRIDQEIDTHRKEIFMRQARITQLEDSRKLFMDMVEADLAATQAPREQHLMAGSHAKPMLIVRPTTEAQDAPLGLVEKGRRKGLPRLRRARKGMHNKTGMRARVLAALQPGDEPVAPADLANHLGLPAGDEKKSMQNALYQLAANGTLKRDDNKRYYRPATNGH